jgi:hypothetical protein
VEITPPPVLRKRNSKKKQAARGDSNFQSILMLFLRENPGEPGRWGQRPSTLFTFAISPLGVKPGFQNRQNALTPWICHPPQGN